MKQDDKYTLITGASAGIGRAIAIECAKRKMNLILVALPGMELKELAEELKTKYEVKTSCHATDLTKKEAPTQLYEWCMDNNLSVNMLINNAGVGYEGHFQDCTNEFLEHIMQLNMVSVASLSHLFIDELSKHPNSYMLNVGSTIAFRPVPYKSIYAATKSFVYSFSRALREELKGTSIKVSCICPGPVMTNGQVQKRINSQGILGKALTLSADKVAYIAIQKLLEGKPLIVPGIVNKTFLLIGKRIPNAILQKILAGTFSKH